MGRAQRYPESAMRDAVDAVNSGESQQRAASKCGVPRSTLQGRLEGASPMRVGKEKSQRLSTSQETVVYAWVRYMLEQKKAKPTHEHIWAYANKLMWSEKLEDYYTPQKLGKHWVSNFLDRHQIVKEALQSADRPQDLLRLDHDWEKALYYQFALVQWFARDLPETSRFDFPGASETFYTFRSAIWHYKLNEPIHGDLLIEVAFGKLGKEVCRGDLNVVQDVCLNIVGMLDRYGSHDTACGVLDRYSRMSLARYEVSAAKRPTLLLQHNFASALHGIIKRNGDQSLYFRHLAGIYAHELERTQNQPSRTILQAQRRHKIIVRDSWRRSTDDETDAILRYSEDLLQSAIHQLGPTEGRTLRIENDTLRLQSYIGRFNDNYVSRVDEASSKLSERYPPERRQDCGSWSETHRSAYLRFQERKFDFYKLKDFDEAVKTADRILENCDYTEDRWMSFALQFEHWLTSIHKHNQVVMKYMEKRFKSEYYVKLAEKVMTLREPTGQ